MALDGHRIKAVLKWLKNRMLPTVKEAVAHAFDAFAAKFMAEAAEIVASLEADLTTAGGKKMAIAISTLAPRVIAAGWEVSEVALRALLETALVAVRVDSGKAIVVPPASPPAS